MAKHEKIKKMAAKVKEGIEQKGGINEHGKYCRSCMSPDHRSNQHAGLVKSGKITR